MKGRQWLKLVFASISGAVLIVSTAGTWIVQWCMRVHENQYCIYILLNIGCVQCYGLFLGNCKSKVECNLFHTRWSFLPVGVCTHTHTHTRTRTHTHTHTHTPNIRTAHRNQSSALLIADHSLLCAAQHQWLHQKASEQHFSIHWDCCPWGKGHLLLPISCLMYDWGRKRLGSKARVGGGRAGDWLGIAIFMYYMTYLYHSTAFPVPIPHLVGLWYSGLANGLPIQCFFKFHYSDSNFCLHFSVSAPFNKRCYCSYHWVMSCQFIYACFSAFWLSYVMRNAIITYCTMPWAIHNNNNYGYTMTIQIISWLY